LSRSARSTLRSRIRSTRCWRSAGGKSSHFANLCRRDPPTQRFSHWRATSVRNVFYHMRQKDNLISR
jgi:hypothetical protein